MQNFEPCSCKTKQIPCRKRAQFLSFRVSIHSVSSLSSSSLLSLSTNTLESAAVILVGMSIIATFLSHDAPLDIWLGTTSLQVLEGLLNSFSSRGPVHEGGISTGWFDNDQHNIPSNFGFSLKNTLPQNEEMAREVQSQRRVLFLPTLRVVIYHDLSDLSLS